MNEVAVSGSLTMPDAQTWSYGGWDPINPAHDAFDMAFQLLTQDPPPPASPEVFGDYNEDGVVNAADYVVFRDVLGLVFELPNENPLALTPGFVDQEDYAFWHARFGANGSGIGVAVPEPTAGLMLVGMACMGWLCHRIWDSRSWRPSPP